MFRKYRITALTLIFFYLSVKLVSCEKHKTELPGNFDSLFSKWFVYNDSALEEQISEYKLTPERIDSLVKVIREKTLSRETARAVSETFVNPSGAGYVTGIYKPKQYSTQERYPLLIYLHGGNGTSKTTKGERAWKMFGPLADSMELFLCSPSANRESPWWSESGLNMILRSLRYMTIHYPIDPSKIFLAGVSDGATGCYTAAECIPGPFAGFFAISGFGGLLKGIGIPIITGNLMQRNIYNVNAGRDHLYPSEQVNNFIKQLKERGVPVIHKIYPDEEHGFDYRDKEYPYILSYMEKWSKPDRKGLSWNYVPGFPNRCDNLVSMEPSGSRAYIYGYWKNDTLVIKQGGFNSVSFSSGRTSLFVKKDGQPPEKTGPVNDRVSSLLDIMKSRCYPLAGNVYEYRLSF